MCTFHRAFEEFEESPESAAASLNALCRALERGAAAATATLARTPTQGRSGRRRT